MITDPTERDLIIRTVIGEAAQEGPVGQLAVAHVIANRMNSTGRGARDIIMARHQFEPWNNPRTAAQLQSISPSDPRYQRVAAALEPFFQGQTQDPTGGATHFYSPTAQASLGRQPPAWDNGSGQDIGRHRFFALGYAAPQAGMAANVPFPGGPQPTAQPNSAFWNEAGRLTAGISWDDAIIDEGPEGPPMPPGMAATPAQPQAPAAPAAPVAQPQAAPTAEIQWDDAPPAGLTAPVPQPRPDTAPLGSPDMASTFAAVAPQPQGAPLAAPNLDEAFANFQGGLPTQGNAVAAQRSIPEITVRPPGAQTTRQRAQLAAEQELDRAGPVAGGANAIVQGLARGVNPFMDDTAAFLNTITGQGQGNSFSERYQANLDAQRGVNAAFDSRNPILSFGGQLAGATALPVGQMSAPANAMVRFGRGAGVGAGYGAAFGFGQGDSLEDRIQKAGTGALVGGVVGGGLNALIGARLPQNAVTTSRPGSADVVAAAERQGIEIPRAIATDSMMAQRAGQGLRNAPLLGGNRIVSAADNMVEQIGRRVDDLATQTAGQAPSMGGVGDAARRRLQGSAAEVDSFNAGVAEAIDRAARSIGGGGVPTPSNLGSGVRQNLEGFVRANDRAVTQAREVLNEAAPAGASLSSAGLGAVIRSGLESSVEKNRAMQDAGYTALRGLINPNKPVEMAPSVGTALNDIIRARTSAGQSGIPSDLMPIAELATRPGGVTFSGLQRARSVLADRIEFEAAQGFDTGDLKLAYGALSEAMQSAVQASVKGNPQQAIAAFQKAETQFGTLAETNAMLRDALRSGPEALANRMVDMATTSGNVSKLIELRKQLPAETASAISRRAFEQLSRGSNGEFSEAALVANWNRMTPEGRKVLFGEAENAIGSAIGRLRSATASGAEANRELLSILSKSDEQIASTLAGMATSSQRGNVHQLTRLAPLIGRENMDGLASLVLQNMSRGADGATSVETLAKRWAAMTPEAKIALFRNPDQRTAIDRLVGLGVVRQNQEVVALLGKSDEQIATRLMDMATNPQRGNAAAIRDLEPILGKEVMGQVAGLVISRLGEGRNGVFTPAAFLSSWERLNPEGKAILFSNPQLRSALDDIATISSRSKQIDRFGNPSGTAQNMSWGAVGLGALADPLTTIGGIIGGNVLSRVLAAPATASSAARWSKAYELAVKQPTAASLSALQIASRNFAATLGEKAGVTVDPNSLFRALPYQRLGQSEQDRNDVPAGRQAAP